MPAGLMAHLGFCDRVFRVGVVKTSSNKEQPAHALEPFLDLKETPEALKGTCMHHPVQHAGLLAQLCGISAQLLANCCGQLNSCSSTF